MGVEADVIVAGAGLAGLRAALRLREAGLKPLVLEASDGVGGRVRTDCVEGFRLDRGFQVLLEAYPEARAVLDYKALQLRQLYPGALVRHAGRFTRVADPFRKPWDLVSTLLSPIGTIADKLRVARLGLDLTQRPVDDLFRQAEIPTIEWLRQNGFSKHIIDSLFIPFIGGVFLELELQTSSIMFEFVFKMMSLGFASLPSDGMGAITAQIAGSLPLGTVRTGQSVARVEPGAVQLEGGERLESKAVIVATDGPSAARLLPELPSPSSRRVSCLYFTADRSPVGEPTLVLDGEGRGPVNNLCVLSDVAPSYSPPGAALISAAVIKDRGLPDSELPGACLRQISSWFGPQVQKWRHLRTYRIAHAVPVEISQSLGRPRRPPRLRPGLYVCGDHMEMGSINGALLSGRRAADCLVEDLDQQPGGN